MQEKPCKVKILQNLNIFLKRLDYVVVSPLTKETLEEIKRLKKHILNNCLSGIPPGFGTERDEQLHKLLNRSLLSGATRINVELVVAILAVLFYHHNSRTLLTKHKCNPRVGCALPIEVHNAKIEEKDESSSFLPPFKGSTGVSHFTRGRPHFGCKLQQLSARYHRCCRGKLRMCTRNLYLG